MNKLTTSEKKKIYLNFSIVLSILILYIYMHKNYKSLFFNNRKTLYLFYIDFSITCMLLLFILFYPTKYIELIKTKAFYIILICYSIIYFYIVFSLNKIKLNNIKLNNIKLN